MNILVQANLVKRYENVTYVFAVEKVEYNELGAVEFFKCGFGSGIRVFRQRGNCRDILFNGTWHAARDDSNPVRLTLLRHEYLNTFTKHVFQFTSQKVRQEFEKEFSYCIDLMCKAVEDKSENVNEDEEELNEKEIEKIVRDRNLAAINDGLFKLPRFSSYINPTHPGVGHYQFHLRVNADQSEFAEFFDQRATDTVKRHWREAPGIHQTLPRQKQGEPSLIDIIPSRERRFKKPLTFPTRGRGRGRDRLEYDRLGVDPSV